jgi:endoglycosylceramidase
MPALQRAYDSFWSNRAGPGGVGLQDRYAAAWRHVATRLGGLPGVLGYDIMNEPWPGSRLDCSSWAGCPDFDRGPLADFNRRDVRAIRQVDRRHLIWHEPLLPYGFGASTSTRGTGDARAGLSFHMYCIGIPGFAGGESRPCAQVNPTYFEHADAVSDRTGDALLLTEFGANIRTPDSIVEATALADRYMVGWQEWQYDDPYSNVPGEALVLDPHQPPAGANVDRGKLDLLSRPYPQAVAGTPVRWSYDSATRRFQFLYRVDRAGGGRLSPNATTQVAVPRLKYPDGYRATIEDGRIISGPNAPVLRIVARRGAKSVMLGVTPRAPSA